MKRFVSVFPPAFSDTYVNATYNARYDGKAYLTTNPSCSLTGTMSYNQWLSDGITIPEYLRFHIDLGVNTIIKKIYYENSNYEGNASWSVFGVKNFTFWGSNSATAFADLVYAHDTDWTQLTTDVSQMVQHVALDISDPHFIAVINSTAYRYYAFKLQDNWGAPNGNIGIRRIELQQEVDVPEITASSTQNISQIHL